MMMAEEVTVGVLQLVFTSCTTASASYDITDGPSGELALIRLTPDVLCEALR